nr:MAG TPA: hypothetical protein [Caudoviricetes sp.]
MILIRLFDRWSNQWLLKRQNTYLPYLSLLEMMSSIVQHESLCLSCAPSHHFFVDSLIALCFLKNHSIFRSFYALFGIFQT